MQLHPRQAVPLQVPASFIHPRQAVPLQLPASFINLCQAVPLQVPASFLTPAPNSSATGTRFFHTPAPNRLLCYDFNTGLKSFFLLHFFRYPKDESPEAMLFKKKARILIDLAKSRVLDALGMPFWLSSGTCLGKILWVYHSGSAVVPASIRCFGFAVLALGVQHIAFDSLIFVLCVKYCSNVMLPLSYSLQATDSLTQSVTPSMNRSSTWLPVLQVGFVSVTSFRIARTSTSGCSSNTMTFASSLPCKWTIYRSNIYSERYVNTRSETSA